MKNLKFTILFSLLFSKNTIGMGMTWINVIQARCCIDINLYLAAEVEQSEIDKIPASEISKIDPDNVLVKVDITFDSKDKKKITTTLPKYLPISLFIDKNENFKKIKDNVLIETNRHIINLELYDKSTTLFPAIYLEDIVYHPEKYGIIYPQDKKQKIIDSVNNLRPKVYTKKYLEQINQATDLSIELQNLVIKYII